MAIPPTLGMGAGWILRGFGKSSDLFNRTATLLKIGIRAIVMNMEIKSVERKII
jgi:hypothetical protein